MILLEHCCVVSDFLQICWYMKPAGSHGAAGCTEQSRVPCRLCPESPASSCTGPFAYGFSSFQDGGAQKLEKAKVSLDDCLACSGCVTSAETVLITQQSHGELRKVLDANKVGWFGYCISPE